MTNAIETCRKVGIHANCTWIMGYPGEELKHIQTSVAFIAWQKEFWTEGVTPGTDDFKRLEAGVNQKMFTATAYPGTEMWKFIRAELNRHFDIQHDAYAIPICDDNFHKYVLELDDATKVLKNKNGDPVNFGEMTLDTFLEVREYIDSDQIEKILDMKT